MTCACILVTDASLDSGHWNEPSPILFYAVMALVFHEQIGQSVQWTIKNNTNELISTTRRIW